MGVANLIVYMVKANPENRPVRGLKVSSVFRYSHLEEGTD